METFAAFFKNDQTTTTLYRDHYTDRCWTMVQTYLEGGSFPALKVRTESWLNLTAQDFMLSTQASEHYITNYFTRPRD